MRFYVRVGELLLPVGRREVPGPVNVNTYRDRHVERMGGGKGKEGAGFCVREKRKKKRKKERKKEKRKEQRQQSLSVASFLFCQRHLGPGTGDADCFHNYCGERRKLWKTLAAGFPFFFSPESKKKRKREREREG